MPKPSDRYAKVVEWSDADGCYVASCLGVFDGSIHGDDQEALLRDLTALADEHLETLRREGRPLPPPTAGGLATHREEFAALAREVARAAHGAAA